LGRLYSSDLRENATKFARILVRESVKSTALPLLITRNLLTHLAGLSAQRSLHISDTTGLCGFCAGAIFAGEVCGSRRIRQVRQAGMRCSDARQARSIRRRDLACAEPSGARPDEGLSGARRRGVRRSLAQARASVRSEGGVAKERRRVERGAPAGRQEGQERHHEPEQAAAEGRALIARGAATSPP